MKLNSFDKVKQLTEEMVAIPSINKEPGGESAVARWRAMLEAGSTRDPLGLAAIAGIDLSTPDALEHTIAYISGIIDEIAALTEEIDGITLD